MSLKHHNFIYKCCIVKYFETQKIQLQKEEKSDKNTLIKKFVQHLNLTEVKDLIKTHKIKIGPNAKREKYFREKLTDFLTKNFQEEYHGICRTYHGYDLSQACYAELPDCYIKKKKRQKRIHTNPSTPHGAYVRAKDRMRKRVAWHNQTPEQHEVSTQKRRSKWNTHALIVGETTVGQIWDARRRKSDEAERFHRQMEEQQLRNKIIL